jgi:hypothetical protein
MAQRLETPRDPFTIGRGFDHDPRPGATPEHGREALAFRPDPPLDQLAAFGQDAQLAFPLLWTSMPI